MSNMFSITNIKNRFISVIAPDIPPLPSTHSHQLHRGNIGGAPSNYQLRMAHQQKKPDKFAYARPPFLQLLTIDELRASADHNVRPIIVPRDISLLPWGTGYAECVNSGKSEWNEDQAAFARQVQFHILHAKNKQKIWQRKSSNHVYCYNLKLFSSSTREHKTSVFLSSLLQQC